MNGKEMSKEIGNGNVIEREKFEQPSNGIFVGESGIVLREQELVVVHFRNILKELYALNANQGFYDVLTDIT
jgi:hypothetical protein